MQAARSDLDTKIDNYQSMYKLCDQDRQSLRAQCEKLKEEVAAHVQRNQMMVSKLRCDKLLRFSLLARSFSVVISTIY